MKYRNPGAGANSPLRSFLNLQNNKWSTWNKVEMAIAFGCGTDIRCMARRPTRWSWSTEHPAHALVTKTIGVCW